MLRKLREAQNEEGFTLIELLVVVLIIGILAAIAIPVFLNQREKAFRDAVASDIRNAAIVMEDYYSDSVGTYPGDQAALTALQFTGTENVTLEVFVDSATTPTEYCIYGEHGSLQSPVETWVYDASGGVTTAAVDHNPAGGGSCSLTVSAGNL